MALRATSGGGGGGGSGTVTTVSVATSNGFTGTVSNPTTTPAITVGTTLTGVLKGNGTAISAATAGTDYQAPITLTTTGSSGAATFVGNTLNIPQYSSGGGSGTVTSVAMSVPAFLSVTGSPVTTSGTLAVSLSGTALPVANGGTGQTTANAALNGLLPSQTSQSGKVLSTDGTNTSWTSVSGSGTVTSVAQTFTGGLISVSGSPVTTSGTLALTVSGQSGGIPYFSSNTTWGTTDVLGNGDILVGGGVGGGPASSLTGSGVLNALQNNVGSAGAFIVNGGALGTPSSATLTSATGLPISTGVSGLGTGVATFLATPSSANLAAAVTDETGSGLLVFATTPTLTNPTVTNYTESVVAIGTVTTSSTISLTSGTVQTATLTASTACTFTMPTATAGKSFVLLLKQAASTGNGTATFTGVKWGTAGAPTITATAGKMDILSFVADGTNWYGSITQGYTP
jgi:hypothetical protein